MADLTLPLDFIFLYLITGATVITLLIYFVGRRGWENGIGNPKSRLRTKFRGALKEDVQPIVTEAIYGEQKEGEPAPIPIGRRLADLDQQRQRLEGELNKFRIEFSHLTAQVEIDAGDGKKVMVPAFAVKMASLTRVTLDPKAVAEVVSPIVTKDMPPLIDAALQKAMQTNWGKRLAAGNVEDTGGALDEGIGAIALQQKNPEIFAITMQAVNFFQTVGPTLGWKAPKINKMVQQAWQAAGTFTNAQEFMKSLESKGVRFGEGGGSGAAPAGSGANF